MVSKTLKAMAIRACVRRLPDLTNVGDIEFDLVRVVLERIHSPEQLRQIEHNSPHIRDHSADLWRQLIQRDFPVDAKAKRYAPANPRSWHKVYERYRHENQQELARATEGLQTSLGAFKARAEANTSRIMTPATVSGMRFATSGSGKRARAAHPQQQYASELNFNRGRRTKTNSAQGILRKARREASEIGHVRNLQHPAAGGTVGASRAAAQGVTRAPSAMLMDRRIENQPAILAALESGQKQRAGAKAATTQRHRHLTIEDLEGPCANGPDELGDDGDGGDDDDDLFGDTPEPPKKMVRGSVRKPVNGFRPVPRPLPSASGARTGSSASNAAPSSSGSERTKPLPPSPPATPSLVRPESAHTASSQMTSPPGPAPRKRKPIDIFMRQTKKKRGV